MKINNARGVSPTAINTAKEYCSRGHEFTPENTYVRVSEGGSRRCRTCYLEAARQRYATPEYRAWAADWRERNRQRIRDSARLWYASRKVEQ